MADQFELGRHDGLIEQLIKGQDAIFARLGSIEKYVAEQKGERRAAKWALTTAGGFVGAMIAFGAHLFQGWLQKH
jgi:hypothetical protein